MTAAIDAQVVFSIMQEPFDDWKSGPFLAVLAAVFFAIAFFTEHRGARLFASIVAIAALALAPLAVYWNWREYQRLRTQFAAGDYILLEGRVANFHPDDWRGSPQSFDVAGRRFVVSRLSDRPGFQATVASGGPNLSGKCVSIASTANNEILWLGIVDSDCASRVSRPAAGEE